MSDQMKNENEVTEIAIQQIEISAEAIAFDDLSDEELEVRISKEHSGGSGLTGQC